MRKPSVFRFLGMVVTTLCVFLVLQASSPGVEPAFAVPSLQLDIEGGAYDLTTESIIASTDPFTLYALLKPDRKATLTDTYYVSAALVPLNGDGIDPGLGDVGSFTFNGTLVNVTGDMVYGFAPIETNLDHDGRDLGPHGIFPTFFSEFSFPFDPLDTTSIYNTQDNPGGTSGGLDTSGSGMYFAAFDVDTTALNSDYALHFDLYNKIANSPDLDILSFAPFSHDAQSSVPEPSTALLLASGLAFLLGMSRLPNR